jgi:hypothetical protein
MTRRQQDHDDADDVKELLTEDGRQLVYSTNDDDDNPSDTEEWIASDTTVSGSEQQ